MKVINRSFSRKHFYVSFKYYVYLIYILYNAGGLQLTLCEVRRIKAAAQRRESVTSSLPTFTTQGSD